MYGKLNELLQDLDELIKQMHKNWHHKRSNLHDMKHELDKLVDDVKDFMQGKEGSGKLQQLLDEIKDMLKEFNNHLQNRSDTVHHLEENVQKIIQNLNHLVHR
nr:Syn-Fes-3 protein [synthetic construct]